MSNVILPTSGQSEGWTPTRALFMVERSRRGKGKLLGSHQKCWVWGRHVVLETLRAGLWPPVVLHLSQSLEDTQREEAAGLAQALGTVVSVEAPERLRELCKSGEHQGYVAKMPGFPYAETPGVLETPGDAPALFAVLDGIQDPYNLGAIIRSAEVFGVNGVFLNSGNQVGVTSLVARSSAGAVNHVPIARDNLIELAARLKENGVRVVGTDQSAEVHIERSNLRAPTALIIGNENTGISDAFKERCDTLVRIPQLGQVGSLNAAVAAGISFYEAARQRSPQPGPQPPTSDLRLPTSDS